MDKYYTPEIEEFHIGFEYEDIQFRPVPTSMGIAKRRIFGPVTLDTIKPFWQIKKDIEDGDIRVKYLDKEDIEGLGFPNKGGNWYYNDIGYQMIGTYISMEISKGHHEYRDVLFSGTIKNKSELKQILKQLNIQLDKA